MVTLLLPEPENGLTEPPKPRWEKRSTQVGGSAIFFVCVCVLKIDFCEPYLFKE